jgi:hypothetical protein
MIKLGSGSITTLLEDDVSVKDGAVVISGVVGGNLEVGNGAAVALTGIVNGNVATYEGCQLVILGTIKGSLIVHGGNVEVLGFVEHNLNNEAGIVKLNRSARVLGEVRGNILE